MYRFALRPRWIISHLFVLLLVVTMVNLGLWQLRRLDEKKSHNAVVTARMDEPVAGVGEVLRAGDPRSRAAAEEFRRVRATGVFERGDQVLVRGRSLDGAPGSWVLAPLKLADGTILVVNRGWISNNGRYEAVPAAYAPPAGTVTVTGLLNTSQERGSFGAIDPPTGRLTNLARADVSRYAEQLDAPVVPAWLQQTAIAPKPPSGATVPRTLGPPELDEGPHFSYAVQWFIFTTIAVVGYPLILRRNAREKLLEAEEAAEAASEGDGGPDPDQPDPDDVPAPGDPRLEPRSS